MRPNFLRGTAVKNIVDSTKKFVKDHKPEIVIASAVVVGVVIGAKYGHRNCIKMTDSIKRGMSTGDMVVVDHRGVDYAIALYRYLPPKTD